MRVLLSAYGSRGDVEPAAGLAVRLRAPGAEVRVYAPPDEEFAERLAGDRETGVDVGRSVARHGHQVRHAGPGALLRPMAASDLRSELMT